MSDALCYALSLSATASLSAAAPATVPPSDAPRPGGAAAASDLYATPPPVYDTGVPGGAAAASAEACQQLAGAAHLLQVARCTALTPG